MITLTIETPRGATISLKCENNDAANEIELLIETTTDCKVRRPVSFASPEQIAEAVRKFHMERGCCNGTFAEPCPFKAKQTETREKVDTREDERRDWEAFRGASLD